MSGSAANKRIAKNTLLLYFRMLFTMAVGLYTSRVVLNTLGVEDFGIYNVVGGIVVLFGFINAALNQSTQRYIAYYIGKDEKDKVGEVYSMSVNVHLFLGLIIFILLETVGLWLLYHVLKFPSGVTTSIAILYQISVLNFIINLCKAPQTSAIISYEHIKFFSYISVIECGLKLGGVYSLKLFPQEDRLVIYGLLMLSITLACWLASWFYCRKSLKTIRYKFQRNKALFKDLLAFNGWNILGGISNIAANQGLNMIFNVFLGVVVNASLGICNQVYSAVNSFVMNFQTAFNPQITKSYASGDMDEFYSFIQTTSRLSFCLICTIGLPVIICCKPILQFWLGDYPEYTVPFCQLMIIYSFIDALSGPLWVSAQACGNIKNYMILMSSMILLNIPIAILLLYFKLSPVWVIGFRVLLNLIIHFIRIEYLKKLIKFPASTYLKSVMWPSVLALTIASPFPIILHHYFTSFASSVIIVLTTLGIAFGSAYFIVLTNHEREFVHRSIGRILGKFRLHEIAQ